MCFYSDDRRSRGVIDRNFNERPRQRLCKPVINAGRGMGTVYAGPCINVSECDYGPGVAKAGGRAIADGILFLIIIRARAFDRHDDALPPATYIHGARIFKGAPPSNRFQVIYI